MKPGWRAKTRLVFTLFIQLAATPMAAPAAAQDATPVAPPAADVTPEDTNDTETEPAPSETPVDPYPPPPASWPRASLRPRLAVHLSRVRQDAARVGTVRLNGLAWRCLRELHLDADARVDQAAPLHEP